MLGRLPRPGHYAGTALLVGDGSWVVSVGQYLGHSKKDGYRWDPVPIERFFRTDVLRRQLKAAGLLVEVEILEGRCTLRFQGTKGKVSTDGGRIKRFLSRHYGSFNNRSVSWKWEIRYYD